MVIIYLTLTSDFIFLLFFVKMLYKLVHIIYILYVIRFLQAY